MGLASRTSLNSAEKFAGPGDSTNQFDDRLRPYLKPGFESPNFELSKELRLGSDSEFPNRFKVQTKVRVI